MVSGRLALPRSQPHPGRSRPLGRAASPFPRGRATSYPNPSPTAGTTLPPLTAPLCGHSAGTLPPLAHTHSLLGTPALVAISHPSMWMEERPPEQSSPAHWHPDLSQPFRGRPSKRLGSQVSGGPVLGSMKLLLGLQPGWSSNILFGGLSPKGQKSPKVRCEGL